MKLELCGGEIGVCGNYVEPGESGEPGDKPQFTRFTQNPQKKAQSNGLQWVTISYYEQSGIINKNIVTHLNLSELIVTHNTNPPKHHNRISCQKGSYATLGKKNTDGLYFGVLPIRIYFC